MMTAPFCRQRSAPANRMSTHPNAPTFHARTRAGRSRQRQNRGCNQQSGQDDFANTQAKRDDLRARKERRC